MHLFGFIIRKYHDARSPERHNLMLYCNVVSVGEFREFLFNLRGEMNINCLFNYMLTISNIKYKNNNTKIITFIYTAYEEANRYLFRYTLWENQGSIYARFRRT